MLVVCLIAIVVIVMIVIRPDETESNGQGTTTQTVQMKIEEIVSKYTSEYPTTPREVMEAHNELMLLGYAGNIEAEELTAYASALRMFYSDKLKEANSLDDQVAVLTAEHLENATVTRKLIGSDIIEVTITKTTNTAEEEEEKAEVVVRHVLNQGTIVRVYHLVKEDGWKIESWESQVVGAEE